MNSADEEMRRKLCAECKVRRLYARRFDMHFDWIDCPFDCDNDKEHWEARERDEVN